MATTLESSADDGRHHAYQHHPYPPPAIPPSPTLTNPDMILPLDEGERESQTPSPPFNLPSLSNLQASYGNASGPGNTGNNGHANDAANAMLPPIDYVSEYNNRHCSTNNSNNNNNNTTNGAGNANGNASENYLSVGGQIGVAYSPSNNNRGPPSSKKNFSRHHMAHRLSDIGEEEGPMPPPRPLSRQKLGRFPVNAPVTGLEWRNSRTTPVENGNNHAHALENKHAGGAVRNGSPSPVVPTPNGVVHSPTHLQSSQQQWEGSANQNGVVSGKGNSLHMGVHDMIKQAQGPGEESSSLILSSEAERILENAKKKLTLMEGNLTRARSSMRSPSLSAGSPSPSPANQPMGLGQPVGGLYRMVSRSDRQASAALRPRPMYSTYQDAAGNRHSRVLSETNLPSMGQALTVPEANKIRSVSALGSSSVANFDKSFRYDPNRAYLTHRSSTPQAQPCSPLANGHNPDSRESTPTGSPGLGVMTETNHARINNIDDFNTVYPGDPPSRTQSQLQVRDLQDQMKGLHIKISSLKVRAQEDGLRRRSLQSLRTPSPLNEADPWFVNAMEYRKRGYVGSPLSPNQGSSRLSPESARDIPAPKESDSVKQAKSCDYGGKRSEESERPRSDDIVQQGITVGPSKPEEPQTDSQPIDATPPADNFEDAEEGQYDNDMEIDREELEEILREPLDEDLDDSSEYVDATPHEEREDAFDYKHFILHSALGNYSHSKLRRASNASNKSVETTRPAQGRSTRHSRANSATSLSTAATFATAAEETDLLYWDRKFNDELRARHHYSDEDLANANHGHASKPGVPRPIPVRRDLPGRANGETRPTSTTSNGSDLSPLSPPPPRSDSANAGSVTPTALASSLVSTVRAASGSPYPNTLSAEQADAAGLNDDDERLLEHLFQSLGNVCMDLQNLTMAAEPDEKNVRVLRRRLDAARRVLDGELDA